MGKFEGREFEKMRKYPRNSPKKTPIPKFLDIEQYLGMENKRTNWLEESREVGM